MWRALVINEVTKLDTRVFASMMPFWKQWSKWATWKVNVNQYVTSKEEDIVTTEVNSRMDLWYENKLPTTSAMKKMLICLAKRISLQSRSILTNIFPLLLFRLNLTSAVFQSFVSYRQINKISTLTLKNHHRSCRTFDKVQIWDRKIMFIKISD